MFDHGFNILLHYRIAGVMHLDSYWHIESLRLPRDRFRNGRMICFVLTDITAIEICSWTLSLR